jgi:hypothetical protein
MAAPHALGYLGAARVNDRVIGPLAAGLGIVAAWEIARGLHWSGVVLGPWLLLAPWVLQAPAAATVNDTAVGLCLTVLAFVRGMVRERFGGGWSFLWKKCPAPVD